VASRAAPGDNPVVVDEDDPATDDATAGADDAVGNGSDDVVAAVVVAGRTVWSVIPGGNERAVEVAAHGAAVPIGIDDNGKPTLDGVGRTAHGATPITPLVPCCDDDGNGGDDCRVMPTAAVAGVDLEEDDEEPGIGSNDNMEPNTMCWTMGNLSSTSP
jgi:hypothetical protein